MVAESQNFKVKLVPEDDYMHPLEAAENFNESLYFNVLDRETENRWLVSAGQSSE